MPNASSGRPGPGPLLLPQARLAACHATAASYDATDRSRVLACYDQLLSHGDNPVVALNRTVAVAVVDGPATALPLLDALVEDPVLADTHRVCAVRAGRPVAAAG